MQIRLYDANLCFLMDELISYVITQHINRDRNLYPTHGYPAWPDPNGLDFIRPNKL